MIKYIRLKSQKNTKTKQIILRERSRKYSKDLKETYIRKHKNIFIFGLEGSGKSREIGKIFNAHNEIYPKKDSIIICATDSLSDWLIQGNTHKEKFEADSNNIDYIEDINKQYVKIKILLYKAKTSVIYIDDLDLLSGKKREIVKSLVKSSNLIIATARNERSINKTLLSIINKKGGYQEIGLNTDASFDATNIIFISAIFAMVATGMHEIAMLIMAGKYMMKPKGK